MHKCKIYSLQKSMAGKYLLTLEMQGDICELFEELKDKELELTLKPQKKKRSLTANAYAWVLINALAEKMNVSPVEIYRAAIKNIGGVSEIVCCRKKAVEQFCRAWEAHGIGWQTEIIDSKFGECSNIICYYGSSTYDCSQMAKLIDEIVTDCKEVGVETLPPQELKSLCEAWHEM